MNLLHLVLLLATISPLTLMEVVKDFATSRCSKFFIQGLNKKSITPTVFKEHHYKRICQRWNEMYRFATLYDTQRRIPVYSAYIFTVQNENMNLSFPETRRDEKWKNEPQLENIKNGPDMQKISKAEMNSFLHQAVDRDYKESSKYTNVPYTRGHVFPRQYAANKHQAESTFTFTNVAPQTQPSNNQWAQQVETPMISKIKDNCPDTHKYPAYIVTGVVPGNKWISITRKIKNNPETFDEGVNIPSYFWTAFCCENNKKHISKAFLSLQNDANNKTYEFIDMSVNILNSRLTQLYKQDFSVFGKLCLT